MPYQKLFFKANPRDDLVFVTDNFSKDANGAVVVTDLLGVFAPTFYSILEIEQDLAGAYSETALGLTIPMQKNCIYRD